MGYTLFYSRLLTKAFTALTLLTLAACSSSGGDGALDDIGSDDSNGFSSNVSYTGSTEPADINQTNAGPLSGGFLASDDNLTVLFSANANDNSNKAKTIANGDSAKIIGFIKNQLLPLSLAQIQGDSNRRQIAMTTINETVGCDTGSISLSGELDDNFLGTLTLTFNNCAIDGFTSQGGISFRVDSFDSNREEIIDATFLIQELTIQDALGTTVIGGSIRLQTLFSTNTERLTLNININDQTNSEQFMLENIIFTTTYDNIDFPSNLTEAISGRFFDSTEGYVDIETIVPFSYSSTFIDNPDSGGELILTGENNKRIRIIANPDNTVTVELDLDADGTFEISADSLPWEDLEVEDGSSFI